jgi:hypothetical protein
MEVTEVEWTYRTNHREEVPVRITPMSDRRLNRRPRSVVTDAPRADEVVEGAKGTFTVDDEWTVNLVVTFVDGQPVPTEVTIRPLHLRDSIGARTWQRFRLGELERIVRVDVAMIVGALPSRDMIPKGYKRPMPGRRGESDLLYAQRAQQYVEAVRDHPRSPVAWLAKNALGEDSHANRQAIRRWRKTAEDRGLITPISEKGRAGGELTDKARALLNGGK